jgi:hypothetical protein
VSTPSSIDSVVVLPAPFPPRSAVVVPRRTVNEMPLTAWTFLVILVQAGNDDGRIVGNARRQVGAHGC